MAAPFLDEAVAQAHTEPPRARHSREEPQMLKSVLETVAPTVGLRLFHAKCAAISKCLHWQFAQLTHRYMSMNSWWGEGGSDRVALISLGVRQQLGLAQAAILVLVILVEEGVELAWILTDVRVHAHRSCFVFARARAGTGHRRLRRRLVRSDCLLPRCPLRPFVDPLLAASS